MRGHLAEVVGLSRVHDDAQRACLLADEEEPDVCLVPDAGAHLAARLQLLHGVDESTSVLRHAGVEERVPAGPHVRPVVE